MPHQCLKCGVLFPEGSTVILRGCPDCRGTRFFFTQDALSAEERQKLLRTSEMGLREAIEQLVQEAKDGTLRPQVTDWLKIDPTGDSPARAGPPPAEPVVEDGQPARQPPGQARVLPGNKLLITLPKRRLLRQREERAVRWDYEAPTQAAVPAPAQAPERLRPVEFVPASPAPPAPAAQQAAPSDGPRPDPEPGEYVAQPETIRIAQPGQYEIDVKRLLEDNPIVIQRDGSYLIHLPSLFGNGGSKHGR